MYCPDSYNRHFKKSFPPWFLADVLSEDTIIKWYKGGYSQKGKTVFLEQMKKMVEWLQSAEEGIWQLHVCIVFQPERVSPPPPPPFLGSITPWEMYASKRSAIVGQALIEEGPDCKQTSSWFILNFPWEEKHPSCYTYNDSLLALCDRAIFW